MLSNKYDVVIVGAGPSGTSCALKLAASGLSVALLDKAAFPRDKTCGDALSVDVINQLTMLSETLPIQFEVQAYNLCKFYFLCCRHLFFVEASLLRSVHLLQL